MGFHNFLNYILIAFGFIFNFFLAGYVFIELVSKKISVDRFYKFPLYLVFSYVISTWTIYLLSLFIGFTKFSILVYYALVLFGFVFVSKDKPYFHWQSLIFSISIFLLFVISLYPAIFFEYKGFYVMGADNWQDTALHLSITQSLIEGNFPPKAPYFSGRNLNYYYFSDFHTAIIGKLSTGFHPRLFVIDNSLLAAIFALSVYVLTYFFTKGKNISLLASFMALFSGNAMYYFFLKDLFLNKLDFLEMIKSGSYVLQYGGLVQMTPLTNYFLQNRPMAAGLPILTMGMYLIADKKFFLAAILIVMSFMFQPIITLVLLLFLVFNLQAQKFKKNILLFMIAVSTGLVLCVANREALALVLKDFKFTSWENNKEWFWYLQFFVLNFGVFVPVLVLGLFKFKELKNLRSVLLWSLAVLIIPFLCVFTIDKYDMLKFFYVLWVPLSLVCAVILASYSKSHLGKLLVIVILAVLPCSALIDLGGSFLNRNYGYSMPELEVGMWIKNNIPQNSVFITNPTVHSPVTDIAGRLRVLSYTNWPYTHGFNNGVDNVFTRSNDVEYFYRTGDIDEIKIKYFVNYIYLGNSEKASYPLVGSLFDKNPGLLKIYSKGGIDIYKIKN